MKEITIISKMKQNKRDWTMKDFISVANKIGIDYRNNGTTHFVFVHKSYLKNVSIPNHKDIHPDYVTKFLKMVSCVQANNT